MGVLSRYRTDRLIQRLLAEDKIGSTAASEIVGKLRRDPHQAVDSLIDRLDQASDESARNIAVSLYKLLDDDTLKEYFRGLRSQSPRTVAVISKILASNHRFSPNRLVPLFEDPKVPTSTLIQILSRHPQRLNAALLLRYASWLEPADHNALFKVIEQIADESLVPHLLKRVEDEDESVRAHVVRLLARFPSEEVARAFDERLVDESQRVRRAAIEGVANGGIQASITALAPLLRDPDFAIQSRAIDALVRLNYPDTARHLLPIVEDESEYVRRAGVEVLNGIADSSLIANLLAVLRDQDWWVRERAADALARIGGPRVVDAMLELIKSDDEVWRRIAVEVINSSRDPRAYDYLIAALGDRDWWVKERAIDALAALGAEDAVPHLLRVLEEDPRARATVLRALAALGDRTVLEHVKARLDDENPQVRLEALRALEALTEESSADEVIAQIRGAMDKGSEKFRDQARAVVANLRARTSAAAPAADAADTSGAAAASVITVTRPGEAPEHLAEDTRINLAGMTPGTILDDRYRFVERLGHGAFGTVMRFEDTAVGEELVLKFLNESVSSDERVTKRFIQELRYARRVTHPNVIRIYDFLRIGGLYGISMEYFPGYPLTRELLADQPMRTDRALRVLREITYGMAAAHRSGVVHRDLKPANVLMSHFEQIKIVDFGIAAAAFRDQEDAEVTDTGDFVGTPAYTSPEQVQGQPVDARTDIYSLGIVMYRMFAGRLPYQDKDRRQLLRRHLEGQPPPLKELNPELPPGLADVVARTMSIDPEHRYASMNDVRVALEQFVR